MATQWLKFRRRFHGGCDYVDIRDYGARGDGNRRSGSANALAIQRAINSLGTYGGAICVPRGNFVVSKPLILPRGTQKHVLLVGASREASKISADDLPGPIFQWEQRISKLGIAESAQTTFRDLCVENKTSKGTVMEWISHNIDQDRLFLTMDNVNIYYLGNMTDEEAPIALNFQGLLMSNFTNLNIMGGSPGPGGKATGWGMKLYKCSHVCGENIFFNGGTAGSALWISDGGNHVFTNTRLDAGSRAGKPGYCIDEKAKNIVFTGLYGEGSDDKPFLRIKDSWNVTVNNLDVGETLASFKDNNLVEVSNSRNLLFIGGKLGDQASLGGSGKAIDIDKNSGFITFLQTEIVGSTAKNINIHSTNSVYLELLHGKSHYEAPDTLNIYGDKQLQGVVLTALNGTKYRISVEDNGTITSTKV